MVLLFARVNRDLGVSFVKPFGSTYGIGRPSAAFGRRIQHLLLTWFQRAHRDLPWRHGRDPYLIWISEVMLQQTTVAAVIPYFERFRQSFPTLASLAAAKEQQVLLLWEGLGYYQRARNLHRAARQLTAANHRQVPSDPEMLRRLPGIGRYTLGAVLSQAFDLRWPIVEANSQRVWCRIFGRSDDPRRGPARKWLWQVAEDLLPGDRVGDFNQAVMDLGALICTSEDPRCGECPLARLCTARRLCLQKQIPPPKTPSPVTEVREVVVVVRRGAKVLLVQRPETGRWPGLWEFPHGSLEPGEDPRKAAVRQVRQLTALKVAIGSELRTLRHGVTRFRITLVGFEGRLVSGTFRSQFYRKGSWVSLTTLSRFPVSAPQRRLAAALICPKSRHGSKKPKL
jgi:A/G-specific adenine glycosylase